MMNLIALLLVLTGTANIDGTGYLHQEILIIRNYNNNNDGLKKVKDAASLVSDVFMMIIYLGIFLKNDSTTAEYWAEIKRLRISSIILQNLYSKAGNSTT